MQILSPHPISTKSDILGEEQWKSLFNYNLIHINHQRTTRELLGAETNVVSDFTISLFSVSNHLSHFDPTPSSSTAVGYLK